MSTTSDRERDRASKQKVKIPESVHVHYSTNTNTVSVLIVDTAVERALCDNIHIHREWHVVEALISIPGERLTHSDCRISWGGVQTEKGFRDGLCAENWESCKDFPDEFQWLGELYREDEPSMSWSRALAYYTGARFMKPKEGAVLAPIDFLGKKKI